MRGKGEGSIGMCASSSEMIELNVNAAITTQKKAFHVSRADQCEHTW